MGGRASLFAVYVKTPDDLRRKTGVALLGPTLEEHNENGETVSA
jgi:hypothetical protein